MQPRLFAATNILARLLIQFATRQGNSYVNVVSSDGTFKDRRFASFLSRHMPTRIIAQPSTDKQRLPKSQVESRTCSYASVSKISRSSFFQMFFYPPPSDCASLQYGDMRSLDTWLIPYSCLPFPRDIKLGVDSNVFTYSMIDANGTFIIHELYQVLSTRIVLSKCRHSSPS